MPIAVAAMTMAISLCLTACYPEPVHTFSVDISSELRPDNPSITYTVKGQQEKTTTTLQAFRELRGQPGNDIGNDIEKIRVSIRDSVIYEADYAKQPERIKEWSINPFASQRVFVIYEGGEDYTLEIGYDDTWSFSFINFTKDSVRILYRAPNSSTKVLLYPPNNSLPPVYSTIKRRISPYLTTPRELFELVPAYRIIGKDTIPLQWLGLGRIYRGRNFNFVCRIES
jgi:hypothetical protein